MFSALDSRLSDLGSIPGQGTALCSWARYFTLIVPLFTQLQVYKWVLINLMLKGNPAIEKHPIQEGGGGGEEILLVASCYRWASWLVCTQQQVYKWVLINLMLEGNPAIAKHPIQED